MEQNNIYYIAGLAITAVVAPIATGLVSYWRLKRLGINQGNVAEITDRAVFRASLLKRVDDLEKQLEKVAARERELIATCAAQVVQIADLQENQEAMKLQLAAKDEEIRKLRKRVKGIEAGQVSEE